MKRQVPIWGVIAAIAIVVILVTAGVMMTLNNSGPPATEGMHIPDTNPAPKTTTNGDRVPPTNSQRPTPQQADDRVNEEESNPPTDQ